MEPVRSLLNLFLVPAVNRRQVKVRVTRPGVKIKAEKKEY